MFREFVVAKARLEGEQDRDTTFAWTVAMLQRAKKLPALRTLLQRVRNRPQSVEEQREMLHMLAGQYGGRVRKKKGTRGR